VPKHIKIRPHVSKSKLAKGGTFLRHCVQLYTVSKIQRHPILITWARGDRFWKFFRWQIS